MTMPADTTAHEAPLSESHIQPPVGLSSPPDSTDALKLEGSDSELSDIEEPEEDIGDVLPDRYENGVPIYMPTMEQFKNFTPYVNKLNPVGMKTGIVKVIPPAEWVTSLPMLHQAIKTIKVKDPIAQEIMGTGGTYRQVNIQHQRSYNLPQWRQLCDQSEHQPPAKRGERRANQEVNLRMGPRSKTSGASVARRRGPGRSSKRLSAVETRANGNTEEMGDRLPTPVSPPVKPEDDLESIKNEAGDEAKTSSKGKASRQPKAIASVSSRRKYNRREAAGKIDEAAFKDFEYRLLDEEFSKERCEELERAYWKTLTYAPPLYGADMPGSLFDDRVSSWNLGKLDNLLDILGTKIPGVNTAYLYLGMWKATFAWHLEDVDLYSINYNHFGAPKQWYSISQKDARRFEAAMKNIWPVDAKACDQFLRHKTFLISPATLLEKYNVKVNKAVQHPGEFVITFPYGYHSGFNMGYNAAEAVNFATETWLEFGRVAKKCECEQAQDSVWIDDHDMRKLRGEETEFEESEGDEAEDEEGLSNLPTPPESSGDSRVKRDRKRKRSKKEKDGNTITKRIRIRIPTKQPCVLCPNDVPSEPLLPTDDGHRAHRICASYIPETDVEPGVKSAEMVTGTGTISKARLELKCNYCRSKKGAAFQCSQRKCTRAYHATCAAAAGVFVEAGERPVFGPDGTEYKEHSFEFSCRFHRSKRDKKVDGEALENDQRIRKAASEVQVNDVCQFQYFKGDIFAGIVVENSRYEEMLLINVLPKGDCREVGYKWLLLPDQSDYRMPKPSASAIPLPRRSKQSLVTSKRQANDLPRKEDPFLPGFTWEEFNSLALERNPSQVNINFSKENQIWYYLGKTSTDAKAQFTEDPAKPRHNLKGHFLDTIAKPLPASSSRQSYPASHPSTSFSHNSLNAARPTGRPSMPYPNSRPAKPYEYKPRSSNDYRVDPQAYRSQQNFLQKSTIPYAFGSDPRFGMEPKWPNANERTPNSYQAYHSNLGQLSPSLGLMGPPSTPAARLGLNMQTPPKPMNPFGSTATPGHNNARISNGARYYAKPNPFAKYPYLQKQHNRSPLDYKSPYSQTGGFMNGYEGNLKEHLKRNPEAIFQTRGRSHSRSLTANPLLGYNNSHRQNSSQSPAFAHQSQGSVSSPSNPATPSSSYPSAAHHSTSSPSPGHHQPNHRPPSVGQGGSQGQPGVWGKMETGSLHPAIRQEYGTMFHHQYQPSPHADGGAPAKKTTYEVTNRPQTVSQKFDAVQPSSRSAPVPRDQTVQLNPDTQASTASAQTYATLKGKPSEEKPLYPHQQYFRNAQQQPQSPSSQQNAAREVPDVPVDSTGLIEKMMANLREVSRRESSPEI